MGQLTNLDIVRQTMGQLTNLEFVRQIVRQVVNPRARKSNHGLVRQTVRKTVNPSAGKGLRPKENIILMRTLTKQLTQTEFIYL